MKPLFYFLFFSVFALCFSDEYEVLLENQQKLSKFLFDEEKYDKEMAPFPDDSSQYFIKKPWNYTLDIIRLKLIDVDEPKEQITVILQMMQTWNDRRLAWKKEDFGNITGIYTRLEKVWSPPFIAFGASEVVEHRDQNHRMVKVFENGTINAHIPLKITSNCKMDLTNFPFDTHICDIRAGLPEYNSTQFNINIWLSDDILNSCLLGNAAWDIVDSSCGQEHVRTKDGYFDDTKMGVVKLMIKRNALYYLYMIVLPIFIINSISIAGVFLKDTEKMDRFTIGLTHIMTMTFILALIADNLPKSEQIPLLGRYIIFGLCTMIVALTFSTYLKKISAFFGEKLKSTRSSFGQRLRRFIGSPLRISCIIIFQIINALAVLFLIYRFFAFEYEYGIENCVATPKTMDVIAEHFMENGFD